MRTRAQKNGKYEPGTSSGYAVLVKDDKCLGILKQNKENGIAHCASAELALAEYFGIKDFCLRTCSRRNVNADYTKGVIVAIKDSLLISALIKLKNATGTAPAHTVEKAILSRYGVRA